MDAARTIGYLNTYIAQGSDPAQAVADALARNPSFLARTDQLVADDMSQTA